ncbi:hypothetical protein HIMB100_00019690 [SAR116 cluster alpha proteobacterium HIMB100]|nr:hypothetical protein HIMB100_00019690 [SAR116 cluster alpha proteobacterium HIMB100]
MRKVLLASTALVALGSVSAMAADVTISGNTTWQYESYDKNDGTMTGPVNGTSIDHDSDVDFKFVNTTDSGLTITMAVGLNEGGSQDDQKLTIAGDFGSLRLSNDQEGVGDSAINAGALVNDETSSITPGLGKYGTSLGSGTQVTYTAPSMNGVTAAVSFTEAGTTTKADSTEMRVAYSTAMDGTSVDIDYVSSSTDDNGTVGAKSGLDATSLGLKIGMGSMTFIASAATKTDNNNTYDYSATTVGASYALGNGMTIGVYQNNTEDDKDAGYEWSQTAASVTYSIAPGLTAGITVTDSEEKDTGATTVSDDYTVLELSASF